MAKPLLTPNKKNKKLSSPLTLSNGRGVMPRVSYHPHIHTERKRVSEPSSPTLFYWTYIWIYTVLHACIYEYVYACDSNMYQASTHARVHGMHTCMHACTHARTHACLFGILFAHKYTHLQIVSQQIEAILRPQYRTICKCVYCTICKCDCTSADWSHTEAWHVRAIHKASHDWSCAYCCLTSPVFRV